MKRSTQATVAATLLRVCTGVLFLAHGWQKFTDGVPATTNWLESLGVGYATLAAPVLIGVELLGGAALMLGAATRFVSLVLLAQMVAAWFLVHRGLGPFAAQGGWELVLLLAVVLTGFALTGSGATGVDRLFSRRARRT